MTHTQHSSTQPSDTAGVTASPSTVSTPRGQSQKRTVKDFTFGRILGEGSYSTVMLGTEKSAGTEFAVKILDKRHIIKEKKTKYVNIEKTTLSRLSHPFIVRLHYAFQDPGSLYFVLDLARNGELLSLIRRLQRLPEDGARFYLAEIVTAVEYLHHKGVIHRDLKPENILLDENMHIKLTDFGTAKLVDESNVASTSPQRSQSFVGTAEYVSPELLTDKTVDKSSDLWALGCILYQLLAGQPPFKGPNEYLTFQKILRLEYSMPDHFSPQARDLVSRLLVLGPSERLGAGESDLSAIKRHPFFRDINWDNLHEQTPPNLISSDGNVQGSGVDASLNSHHHPDNELGFVDDSDLFQQLQQLPVVDAGVLAHHPTSPSIEPHSATLPLQLQSNYDLRPPSLPPTSAPGPSQGRAEQLTAQVPLSPELPSHPSFRQTHEMTAWSSLPPNRNESSTSNVCVQNPNQRQAPPPMKQPERYQSPITSPPPSAAHFGYYDRNSSNGSQSSASTPSAPDPHFHNLHCDAVFHEGGKIPQSAKPWTWHGRLWLKFTQFCSCCRSGD
ncbi:serine/threonine protein kinase [Dispira parvispora]|uniref:non-specific serine/threonine protein kinase n=1 Tax=Dispira parvispora TaxID=1520584 RepID=A0A9W8AZJ0_9FUNG|nr:serine/threonine protein kinase [Dispira parvispora]